MPPCIDPLSKTVRFRVHRRDCDPRQVETMSYGEFFDTRGNSGYGLHAVLSIIRHSHATGTAIGIQLPLIGDGDALSRKLCALIP